MLKSFVVLLRFFIFWLLFFLIDQIIFLAYFTDKLKDARFSEILTSLLYGMRLNASMAGYISILPLLVFIFLWFFPQIKISKKAPRYFVVALVVIFAFLSIVNFNIYREWGTKINYRALDFAFNSTKEAVASSSSSPVVSSFTIFFIFIFGSFFLAKRIIDYKMPQTSTPFWIKGLSSILFIGLLFLCIRGNLGTSPINQSMAYFSDKPFLNHAAVNTEWNLMHDLINNKYGNQNPYNYYPEKEAQQIVADLYQKPEGEVTSILSTPRPNVVIILLESFTADLIESLGGEKGVAPNMEKLISEGLLFKNIYASGDRTDKGLIAVLSAFPAQATRSIMGMNDKQEKLPAIAQALYNKGYSTSFYYGGESEFFNIKSYVLSHNYQKLVDIKSFPSQDLSSWGAFDHKVFEKNVADLDAVKQPFFSTILTLTNHEPFQLPGKAHFPGENMENKFRSTAFYTDSSLAAYIQTAKTKSWYQNTLFIVVADHGHRLPKNIYENYDPNRFRIPLILLGGALKPEFRGKTVEKLGSQTDIAATLLSQLGVAYDQFKWSHDLLNSATPEFSFFDWDNGFGFANKHQIICFDNIGKTEIYRHNANNTDDHKLLRNGKAYMQQVFQEYLNY